MTPAARAAAYWHQTGRVMSKRQQKRYRRKALRGPSLLSPVASVSATEGAPRPLGHIAAHAPTVTPSSGPVTVGASPQEVAR